MKIACHITFACMVSCSANHASIKTDHGIENTALKEETIPIIQGRTLLPSTFTTNNIQDEVIKIPNHLLQIGVIKRGKTELRDGPAIHFNIQNSILNINTFVLIFDRKDQWVKVFDFQKTQSIGWVHEKTIEKTSIDINLLKLSTKKLQTVTALQNISNAFSFPEQRLEKVDVKKGHQFLQLQKNQNKILVVIGETNTVMWIDAKEAG